MIVDQLAVEVFPDPVAFGAAAATAAAESLRRTIEERGTARLVLAAAPSQTHTLAALSVAEGIDWSRVQAFDMDEYVGLPVDAEQRFGRWLRRHFTTPAPLTVFDPDSGADPEAEAVRQRVGLGSADRGGAGGDRSERAFGVQRSTGGLRYDGHRAGRRARRDESAAAVDEGLFARIDDVPTHAWTLSVPRLLRRGRSFGWCEGWRSGTPTGNVCRGLWIRTGPPSGSERIRGPVVRRSRGIRRRAGTWPRSRSCSAGRGRRGRVDRRSGADDG